MLSRETLKTYRRCWSKSTARSSCGKCMGRQLRQTNIALAILGLSLALGEELRAEPSALNVVVLGDSITKGVRPGVATEQTFAALLRAMFKDRAVPINVVNTGIGGERTDQAFERLATVVKQHRPAIVTIMYGTNDSYIDPGKAQSRLSLDEYQRNLRNLVSELLLAGIQPVLMTEPRWAADAGPNGAGEHPNARLEPYCAACRSIAKEWSIPLVDHFAHWSEAEKKGQQLREWTTDGCHPNPRGHREMADAIFPVLHSVVHPTPVKPTPFRVELKTVLEHDDKKFLWFHPRVAAIPSDRQSPAVLMTLQKHLHVSDYYSGLSTMQTSDLAQNWSGPKAVAELDWVRGDDGVITAVADVTPGWHPPTRKVLAIGAQVRYDKKGEQLEDKPFSNQTAYSVYDPVTDAWTKWRTLELPKEPKFNFARSACAQWLVEPDGTLLLPFYFAPSADKPYSVTVVRCSFDGTAIRYVEHGTEFSLNVVRGLVEPSIAHYGDSYFLTIRNDVKGYVTKGSDGLHFRPIQPWLFDDGRELGSYNTQQHWLTHGNALFLSYTRRGANNDHIMRHRAPLFLAQVDPETLRVLRSTEQVLIPERGATLGNFGAARITERESWVTDAEGVWNDEARKRGAKGAVFLARVHWGSADK